MFFCRLKCVLSANYLRVLYVSPRNLKADFSNGLLGLKRLLWCLLVDVLVLKKAELHDWSSALYGGIKTSFACF